jgi:DNA-binding PucR family transcriptional regulator
VAGGRLRGGGGIIGGSIADRPADDQNTVPGAGTPGGWLQGDWDPSIAEENANILPAWVQEMAAELDLSELCDRVVARDIAVAFPRQAGNDAFAEHLRASVQENLNVLQQVLSGQVALSQVRLEQPLLFARVQAELRVPQTALQRSYRVGFTTMWEAWADRLTAVAEATDVPRAEAMRALARLTSMIFDYQDHVASQVAENFARVDEALSRTRAHVRQGLVRDLLRREQTSLAPSDLIILEYDLSAHHVAVLLPALAEGAASQLVVAVRARTGVRQSLVQPLDLTRTTVWLAYPTPWAPDMRSRLLAMLTAAGVEASLSDALPGLEGFVHAFEQAQEVETVRTAWERAHAPTVVQHSDVALEILLMRDPARAHRFVSAELGVLAENTPQATRLRETLAASFRLGSHVAAAGHLRLHEHTIRNRLHKAEELLGRPLHHRPTELQVALRLQRLLASRLY